MTHNICIFGSELAPSTDGTYIGGSATSAIRLSKALAGLGHNIHIVSTAPRDWSATQIREYSGPGWANTHIFDAKSQHPGVFEGVDLLYSGVKELVDYCLNHEVNIIHSHSGFSVLAAISVLAAKYSRLPVIHSQYCPIDKNPKSVVEFLSSPIPARITLNRVNHVLSMTRNVQQSLQAHGIQNSSFIPPVIDTDKYRSDLSVPESINIDKENLTILFVGNLKPDKGVEYLIKGAGEAKKYGITPQLVLTTERDFPGSEHRREKLNNLIDEYNLQENVVELGIINDMPNVIAHVDVLVAPFTTTSGPSDYPLVVLEAMASQTPVIASNIGGIPELIENSNGSYLVPPENSNSIKQALIDIEQNQPSVSSRSFIKQNFAPETVAEKVLEVYNNYV